MLKKNVFYSYFDSNERYEPIIITIIINQMINPNPGLLYLVPGLIHSYHPDGGANSIAGFTKYEICEQELLFFFRNVGNF